VLSNLVALRDELEGPAARIADVEVTPPVDSQCLEGYNNQTLSTCIPLQATGPLSTMPETLASEVLAAGTIYAACLKTGQQKLPEMVRNGGGGTSRSKRQDDLTRNEQEASIVEMQLLDCQFPPRSTHPAYIRRHVAARRHHDGPGPEPLHLPQPLQDRLLC
jgi:hypothetical protein